MWRISLSECRAERDDRDRGPELHRSERVPECADTQDAGDKNTQTPLNRTFLAFVGEKGANTIIFAAEPHSDRFGKPVSQSIYPERNKRKLRVRCIEIDH